MTGHSYLGIGLVVGVIALVLAAAFGAGIGLFALIIAAAVLFLAIIPFVVRRAQGGSPEPSATGEVSDPDAPADASPQAPHGYTPST